MGAETSGRESLPNAQLPIAWCHRPNKHVPHAYEYMGAGYWCHGGHNEATATKSLPAAPNREEKERLRDQDVREAEALLYGAGRYEETYSGDMAAASAHASLAVYWQARIEWEHGVG